MDPALVAAVAMAANGEKVNVTRVCREAGVSRSAFYLKLARFKAEGSAGLAPRCRAPRSRPTTTPAHVAEAVVRARKELADQGWDHGALTIRWRLLDIARSGVHPTGGPVLDLAELPSRATVHRLLVERGQVVPQPRKRPQPGRRFVHPAPNAVWQIDGTDLVLADGTEVTVVQIIDDHSRLDVACQAATSENGAAVWAALSAGFAAYGHPACVLSDNGAAFSGKRRRWPLVEMERGLAQLGITTIVSSIGHPQTCGKNERAHKTLQQWLHVRPAPESLDELQVLLDAYREGYNHRRHQALGGDTPTSASTPPTAPAPPVPPPASPGSSPAPSPPPE